MQEGQTPEDLAREKRIRQEGENRLRVAGVGYTIVR